MGEHNARLVTVGHGTPRTFAAKCRACGWRGMNTTSRVAAIKNADRHNEKNEEDNS